MRREINPAIELDLVPERTLNRAHHTVSVVIPAHNEASTVAEVVSEAFKGLALLDTVGDVLVVASGCTDNTAAVAAQAGANVVEAPAGKGAAITAGIQHTSGDVVCLIDGDLKYFGEVPLVTILAAPILHGTADATISDLYWRPIYPQLWLYGFFAPLAGRLFPELLPKVGTSPWSGQRAAIRSLWPATMPTGFTVDLDLLMHWNTRAVRMRPVLADDWVNPQRPKPDLMWQECQLLVRYAIDQGRLSASEAPAIKAWFDTVHHHMADYLPDTHNPQQFEHELLETSLAELHKRLDRSPASYERSQVD